MKERFLELVEKIREYGKARFGPQAPADLVKSIVIEAAELLEHFQFDETNDEHWKEQLKKKDLHEIGFEVADILWYLIAFCNQTSINILEVMAKKYEYNEKKYPVEMFKKENSEELYYAQKAKYRREKN